MRGGSRRYPGYSESYGGVSFNRGHEFMNSLAVAEQLQQEDEQVDDVQVDVERSQHIVVHAVLVPAIREIIMSTRILGKTMRDAVRNKERWKRHRTPTQDPSGRDGPRPRPSSPRRPRTPRIQPPPRPARIVFCCCVEFHRFSLPSWSQAALKSA